MSVLVALALKAQPLGDDFCRLAMAPSNLWPEIVLGYTRAGGRWLSRALDVLVMGGMDFARHYGAWLCAAMALRLVAAYRLARTVLDADTPRLRVAILSSGFCLLTWCVLASAGDSVFWLNGALEYEVVPSGILLFLSVLWNRPLTPLRSILLAGAAFILAGGHEVAAVAVVVILAAGCWLVWLDRRPDRRWWLAVLIVGVAGALVEILAPGNFARADRMTGVYSLSRSVATTLLSLGFWVPRLLLDAPVLLGASILLLDPAVRLRREWIEKGRVRRRVACGAAGGCIIAAACLIAGLGTGGLLPGRLVNVLQLVLLMTVAATILLWKPDVQPFAARRFLPLLVAGTFTSMFVAGNPALGVADLALRIPAWTKARSAALDTLASFAGSRRAASFPELPPVPHMYFDYDASIDPREYPNLCLARYYNLESVTGTRRPLSIRGAAYSGRSWGLLDRAPSETSR